VASSEYPSELERGRRGIPPVPATWPHAERRQPRSRLDQALSVAQQLLENSESTWEAERRRVAATDQLFPEAPILQTAAGAESPIGHRDGYGADPYSAPIATGAVPRVAADAGSPENVVIDLRDRPSSPGPAPTASRSRYGLGRAWGAGWSESAQGWIGTETEKPVWRPVVTTTPELPEWQTETYLGIVTAEVAIEAHSGDTQELGDALAAGRDLAMTGLVDDSLERGAHAVVGVSIDYTPFGNRIIITVSGTAVTLRDRS
jgi:uncharacterized protein YbjQ (UPF0145 family)